jgi:hypothetical protein
MYPNWDFWFENKPSGNSGKSPKMWSFFRGERYVLILTKKTGRAAFWANLFTNSSGHPAQDVLKAIRIEYTNVFKPWQRMCVCTVGNCYDNVGFRQIFAMLLPVPTAIKGNIFFCSMQSYWQTKSRYNKMKHMPLFAKDSANVKV